MILLAAIVCFCGCISSPDSPLSYESSWALGKFEKVNESNPILQPDSTQTFICPIRGYEVNWESRNVLNPTAVVRNGKVHMIYRAQDQNMTSRLGLAISDDGIHFTKQSEPIFFPDNDEMKKYEWPGGAEDPRIVESEDGRYLMTYTSYDGMVARLCLASSADLLTWTKHGPVLSDSTHINMWSKAGAIVARQEGQRFIATKIDGKYWMYFGDTDIFIATSEDMINWTPAINHDTDKLVSVLTPRPGRHDSRLVEPGPFGLIREEGIVLIYNGMNASIFGDPDLPTHTYAAGQALFDLEHPYQFIDRTDSYFIHPEEDYELVGEVNRVCFVEGLVELDDTWFLYYGTADSKIAVATANSF